MIAAKYQLSLNHSRDMQSPFGTMDGRFMSLGEVHDLLNSRPASDWVAVSERMPEDDVQVLFYCPQFNEWTQGQYRSKHVPAQAWRAHRSGELFPLDCITHWMPLPSPPGDKP